MEKGRFQKALEVVEALTEEERESLLEVVRKRSIEERRNRIAGSIKEARAEYKSGNNLTRKTFPILSPPVNKQFYTQNPAPTE